MTNDTRRHSAILRLYMCIAAAACAAPLVAPIASYAASTSWRGEQDKAVRMARNGNVAEGLAILQRLHNEHPDDTKLSDDIIAVSGWAGHDDTAVSVYNQLPDGSKPVYVVNAVGMSYRNLHKPDEAAEVYREGLRQSPGNETYLFGLIHSLQEGGHYEEAQEAGEADLKAHGNRVSVLAATASAAIKNGEVHKGLLYAERANDLAPGNKEAVRGMIFADDAVGAPQVALELANKHPGVLSDKEHRQLEGDEAAFLVRWGTLEPVGEADRFKETDQAIAVLDKHIAEWSALGPDARDETTRARFDRMVAYKNRSRMKEVVAEYEKMKTEGITPPSYALNAVGDAYLYLHQPEKARDLYKDSLKKNPSDFDAERQLFFAYVETDDYSNAYKTIDKLHAKEPLWIYLKGEPERLENPERDTTDIDVASARIYGEELSEANGKMESMTAAGASDPRKRYMMGTLDVARGLPREGYRQYETGMRLNEGHDPDNESGMVMADIDMRSYADAGTRINGLLQRYPENLDVQRAKHLWDIHNGPEISENAYYNFRPSGSAVGGEGWGSNTELFSSPIYSNWRVFAEETLMHESEPNAEGRIFYQRSALGAEYRSPSLVASFAPTFNRYHTKDRVGADATADWHFNDRWSVGAAYELFSPTVPLRALNSNVHADRYDLHAEWRNSESTDLKIQAQYMPFSDHNNRYIESGEFAQRLFTTPHFRFDGLVDLSTSTNDQANNRNYFNPSDDFNGLAGLRVSQVLYRRYETLYEHMLSVEGGSYWQQHYDSRPTWEISYAQTLHANDVFDGTLGANWVRQAFDGRPENDFNIVLGLVGHF